MSKSAQSVFAGRRVIVTRPIDQAAGLMTALADLGAEPVALPLLRIESVMAPEALAAEFVSQSAADLWIFTSVNAVVPLRALPAPAWPPRVIAIGQATAAALAAMGVNAWSPASGSRSEDLLADPRLGDVGGLTVTLAGGEGGRSLLADTLRARGATVNVATVYRRVAEAPTAAQLATALERADVVHFTSAEAMSAYLAAMQAADRSIEGAGAPRWLVISPRLVDHAKSLGYSDAPLLAAGPYDADLIAALHSHFGAVSSMSDPSSKSAEPVSVPAAPKPPAAPPKPPAPPPRAKSGGRGAGVAIFFALVAILISAGGVAAGYWAWMQLDTSRALLIKDSEQTQRVAEDVARQQNAAMDIAQQVGDQAAALQLRMEGYDEAVGQLKDRIDLGSSQITLTTVEQLLLLANERLQLAGDIKGADTALNRADDRLARLADPRLHGVREAISRERAALAALPRFDREGVALALSSLIERLDNLPLAPNVREAPEMDLSDVDMDGERPVLDRLGDILRQLFVLRREGGENIGALPESAAATTVLLLHVKLENARAAWLAGDVTNFVRILTSAQQWLARHFAVDQPAVSAFEAEIQRLQRQPEMGELPDLTRSLTLMRAQLEPGAR